ncbi:MAG: lytic transglycosylase domain-containing protein [Tannerella sp.]|jgi:hypothetical protein|nr:lytic transglycosylase domain-containing protein [Tannerella sp.]
MDKMKILHGTAAFLAAGVLCPAVLLLAGYRDSAIDSASATATTTATAAEEEDRPVVRSFTVSPETPPSVRFCGKEIELVRYNMREGMDRELSSFTYYHSTTMLLIKRANRYFPVIEPVLKANGIPDDFKYLAVVESHLDPTATSPARAAGLWQFLESTGRNYGLRVTATVDERRNVTKSTEAACRYLREAYGKYGDWTAVASSYNAGMGRISGQMEKQQETSVLNLHLVEESARYPYRIFAVKQIFENPGKYGFILKAENLYRPIACSEVEVSEDIADLAAFARGYGITYHDLKYFNPWLKDSKLVTGGGKYTVRIPDKRELFYHAANTYVHDGRWVVR